MHIYMLDRFYHNDSYYNNLIKIKRQVLNSYRYLNSSADKNLRQFSIRKYHKWIGEEDVFRQLIQGKYP